MSCSLCVGFAPSLAVGCLIVSLVPDSETVAIVCSENAVHELGATLQVFFKKLDFSSVRS
jgi:hypothetical protein